MDNDIEQLKKDVRELKEWKKQREIQQITIPFDEASLNILRQYFLHITRSLFNTSAGGNTFENHIIKQANKGGVLSFGFPLQFFTASASTDVLTLGKNPVTNDDYYTFSDGQQVFLMSTGTLPAPLLDSVSYYIVNASGDGKSFKLEATFGGGAINITDAGTGEHFIQFLT